MIKNKQDLKEYLQEDRNALGNSDKSILRLLFDPIWRFEILLRLEEYCANCKHGIAASVVCKFIRVYRKNLGIKLGYSIPINIFGKGLSIAHIGTIVISDHAIIGDRCRVHVGVNVGLSYSNKGPKIGNNVYLGPGAKIFGDIVIADNIAVGANAVVNKSFKSPGVTLGGVPAKIISDKGSCDIWKH